MKLFYNGWITKVVLILLGSHVVGSEDVLLEHELLRVLLALAHDALVGAAIGPMVLSHFYRG